MTEISLMKSRFFMVAHCEKNFCPRISGPFCLAGSKSFRVSISKRFLSSLSCLFPPSVDGSEEVSRVLRIPQASLGAEIENSKCGSCSYLWLNSFE